MGTQDSVLVGLQTMSIYDGGSAIKRRGVCWLSSTSVFSLPGSDVSASMMASHDTNMASGSRLPASSAMRTRRLSPPNWLHTTDTRSWYTCKCNTRSVQIVSNQQGSHLELHLVADALSMHSTPESSCHLNTACRLHTRARKMMGTAAGACCQSTVAVSWCTSAWPLPVMR